MTTRYPSRVDWWLGALLGLLVIVSVIVPVIMGVTEGLRQVWPSFLGSVVIVFILAGLVLPMFYELREDELFISAGLLLRIRIPYALIDDAALTSNPLSSPALSLRRILIHHRKPKGGATFVMISPEDRLAFLAELARRTGRHHVEGERLVPTTEGVTER